MGNKENIEHRILEGAKELFAKYGFNRVKTDDIATELGISKRTIYEHFPSKEALFEEVMNIELFAAKNKLDEIIHRIDTEQHVNLIKELQNLLNLSSTSRVTFTKEFYDDMKKFTPDLWKRIIDFREEMMRKHFSKLAKYGKQKGYFKEDVNEDVVFLIHIYIFQNILDPAVLAELPMTAKETINSIYNILFTGILTDEGRIEFEKGKK